jgi:predicted transcriptional regulator
MAKEAVFTLKLEPELRDAFMKAAAAADRPASQIVREMMRDYVQQDRDYVDFLRRKVERSRQSIADGKWSSHEDVEARAAARRAELQRRLDGTDK